MATPVPHQDELATHHSSRAVPVTKFCGATEIKRDPADVFTFLAALENHWPLLGNWLVKSTDTGPQLGIGQGAELVVRVPYLPMRRRIVTRVDQTFAPIGLRGTAKSGSATAEIRWELSETESIVGVGTAVWFEAAVHAHSKFDVIVVRLLRHWLQNRCEDVLNELKWRLESAT